MYIYTRYIYYTYILYVYILFFIHIFDMSRKKYKASYLFEILKK